MPTHHRYEPVPSKDHDENFPLRELPDSNDSHSSYFSGSSTSESAPPPFYSRTTSLGKVEQPVPFGSVMPGSANNTNSTDAAWTPPSTVTQEEAVNEVIGNILARIEKIEADVVVKRNDDGDVEERDGDVENTVVFRKQRQRQREDRCCMITAWCLMFSLVAVLSTVIAVVWIEAWGKRGCVSC